MLRSLPDRYVAAVVVVAVLAFGAIRCDESDPPTAADRAIADYDRTVARRPVHSSFSRDDYDRDIADHSAAIQLNSSNAQAYYGRATAYSGKGDYDHAILDYDRALELRPGDHDTHWCRGLAYAHKRDYESALADFDRAVALRSDWAPVYGSRADAYFHMKEYDRAWADAKRFRELGCVPDPAFLQALETASGRSE